MLLFYGINIYPRQTLFQFKTFNQQGVQSSVNICVSNRQIYQFLPGRNSDPEQKRRPPVAIQTFVTHALWILTVCANDLWTDRLTGHA